MEKNFWNDKKNSSIVLSKLKRMQNKKEKYITLYKEVNNLIEINNLLLIEQDEELAKQVLNNTKKLEEDINNIEIETFFNGKYDKNNAIVTIHPGAGGTESQDWAEMLYRMYGKWANANNFTIKELYLLEGEEAGIKSVTFLVEGEKCLWICKERKRCT